MTGSKKLLERKRKEENYKKKENEEVENVKGGNRKRGDKMGHRGITEEHPDIS